MSSGLTKENIYSSFPEILKNSKVLDILAQSTAQILADRLSEIESIKLYTSIDSMPELLCDILASDFKIDWYGADYTLAEKRATLKSNWDVHRHLGTKGAVERALSSVYPDSKVEEWYNYEGSPFHFKIQIDAQYQQVDPVKYAKVIQRVNFYKNLRSVLDAIEFIDFYNATLYCNINILGEEVIDGANAN